MTREEVRQRSKNVARLRGTGLYSNKEIAQTFRIDESTVSHICNERALVPSNPFLSFEEAAQIEDVNVAVIRDLTENGLRLYRLPSLTKTSWGVDINGIPITKAVKLNDVKGISKRWLSVAEAAITAGMATPRGMYNRALKGQVASIYALEGEAYHINGQTGLKILVDRESIKPVRQRPAASVKPPKLPSDAPAFHASIYTDTGRGEQVSIDCNELFLKVTGLGGRPELKLRIAKGANERTEATLIPSSFVTTSIRDH